MERELKMTEYERRRMENVKRNAERMSSLKLNSILSSSSFKRPSPRRPKSFEKSRSSSRTQGIPPSHPCGLPYDIQPYQSRIRSFDNTPISMRNVYKGDEESHQSFVETLSALEMNSVNNAGRMTEKAPVKVESENGACGLPKMMSVIPLEYENVRNIVPDDLTFIRFLPTSNITVVVAGSRSGHLGFWKVNTQDAYEDREVHCYRPHSSRVYGVSVHPFSPSKVYSFCYDGLLKVMNIEKEEFEVVYSSTSESSLYSLSQHPNDVNSIFIGEGQGTLNMYDARAGKIINSWLLHEEKINSIDINPTNTNVIVTASSDGFASLWDLRKMSDQQSKCKAFRTFSYERCIHSAYFSPSGSCLAITSVGSTVASLSGANFEDTQMIFRGSFHPSLNSCSRAIWGWDDTYLYMACKKRCVEVLSVPQAKAVFSLTSPLVSSIPNQVDAHPCTVGMLAGANIGGKVFLWTSHDG